MWEPSFLYRTRNQLRLLSNIGEDATIHIEDMSIQQVNLQISFLLLLHHICIHILYIYISFLHLQLYCFFYMSHILFASSINSNLFFSFMVDSIVIIGSIISISFISCNIFFIVFAAVGAQEPFSIIATFLFW